MNRKSKTQLGRAKKLTATIEDGDIESLENLVAKGWDVNETLVNDSPLVVAVACKNIGVAKFLIESGAKLDKRSHVGYTALMHACGQDDLAMASMLIEAGADAKLGTSKKCSGDPKGMTPLMIAIRHKNDDLCAYLLEVAGCEGECHGGWGALNFALEMGIRNWQGN